MKKLQPCVVENCVESPSSCITWNGGEIEYLGVCNGESINLIVWEIIGKLKEIAGEDLSQFNIDSLLDVCNKQAPLEVNLISILTLMRDNEICLKDYIDTLNDKITELAKENDIEVNLRCYTDYDNLGNALSITRNELDQLVVNELCDHKNRIQTLEGKLTALKAEVDNIDPTATVEELSFPTCIDSGVKPTSVQVKGIAQDLCNLKAANGTATNIASALSKTPSNFNSKFHLLTGWDLTPSNWAEHYGNLLLAFANVLERLEYMENNCCAITCDDIKVGYVAVMNEDGDGVILRFNSIGGTNIPTGFTDKGSSVTITDKNGEEIVYTISISNNAEIDLPVSGLDRSGPLDITVNSRIGNGSILCDKCLSKKVQGSGSACCVYTNNSGAEVTLVYETPISSNE